MHKITKVVFQVNEVWVLTLTRDSQADPHHLSWDGRKSRYMSGKIIIYYLINIV